MSKLPPGWAPTTLGEVGEYLNGRGFKRSEWREKGRPIIRIQNLTGSSERFNYFDGEPEERYTARPGDVLMSWAATLGVFVWRGPEAVVNQHIFKVQSRIDRDFHRYLLEAALVALRRQTHGSGMVHITRSRFDATPIALPPLAEQRRIVAAIEEQFSRLDAADLLIEQCARRLRRLPGALISQALGGGWERRPLGSLLREPLRNGHSAKADAFGSVRTLTLTAVTTGVFSEENTKMTDADPRRVRDLWLKAGDVLIQRSNTPDLVGTAARYRGPDDWAVFPDLLIRVRPNGELRPEFLELVLKSSVARRYFRRAAKGIAGTMPKIDQGTVEELPVPLPAVDEQARIVADVEQRLASSEALGGTLNAASRRSRSLRRAILERAFRGELVPQDPSDEPASVLLERIRAERAAAEPPRKGSSRRTARSGHAGGTSGR